MANVLVFIQSLYYVHFGKGMNLPYSPSPQDMGQLLSLLFFYKARLDMR